MPHVVDDLLRRRVLLVTGKGGTGKSTVAAALAVIARERGRRTLVVDVDARGDVARFLGSTPAGYRARQISPRLHHLEIHADEALEEYLRLTIKLPRLYRFGPMGRVLEFIAEAAPGVEEVLIAGKIAYEERARRDGSPRWDLIVVDAAPTGRVLSHIRGPRTLTEMVTAGALRSQTEWVREALEDPDTTAMVVVSLAEEMPVAETAELIERAPAEVRTPVAAIVANRVARAAAPDVVAAFDRVAASSDTPLDDAVAALALQRRLADNQAPHLRRLRALGPPVLELPETPMPRHTLPATRALATALEDA